MPQILQSPPSVSLNSMSQPLHFKGATMFADQPSCEYEFAFAPGSHLGPISYILTVHSIIVTEPKNRMNSQENSWGVGFAGNWRNICSFPCNATMPVYADASCLGDACAKSAIFDSLPHDKRGLSQNYQEHVLQRHKSPKMVQRSASNGRKKETVGMNSRQHDFVRSFRRSAFLCELCAFAVRKCSSGRLVFHCGSRGREFAKHFDKQGVLRYN